METNTIEVKKPKDYVIIFFFEIIGTLILTLGSCFAYRNPGSLSNIFQADIMSSGLFCAILITKRVTGSHLNSGITVAVAILE
jgi:glycerol uptake facilitator-like aquaporin